MADPLLIAKANTEFFMLPGMANRHGMVAGATGTGKTVTIHAMAEQLSRIGVPVFLADVKGDLAGISQTGGGNAKVDERVQLLGLADHEPEAFPVIFWDVYGQQGHPLRTTISEMGPLLLARLLQLNDTQTGVLQLVFRYADDQGMLLLDLKDLRAMLQFAGDNAKALTTEYGAVSRVSVGAIQRGLLALEEGGGALFFGEPALNLFDFMQTDKQGRGIINILAADKLMQSPTLYATCLLWLLSELFETMPEVGDPEKPKLVFFFDEAHLLFNDAPPALQDKIEQVVRLIRSKGVGIYFVSQNPLDIPDPVLGQLGNRVQHALRAFTPRDQKAVKAAATTFRVNPTLDVEAVITELGVGEALVSFLDEKGAPCIVDRAFVIPPRSRIGVITPEQRLKAINWSPVQGKYDEAIDRESAYELLRARADQATATTAAEAQAKQDALLQKQQDAARREAERQTAAAARAAGSARSGRSEPNVIGDVVAGASRSFGRSLGTSLMRGILGSLNRR
ncbi:MAG: helicase HerA-like domain-containing protein [Thermomicrobiales bacterium]